MKKYENVIEILNKPIISDKAINYIQHKIFIKYTSEKYLKYAIDILDILCKKSKYENKIKIFHKSLHFLLQILYNSGNNIFLSNYDLLILICFYFGLITIEIHTMLPNISKLKLIYSEKFGSYSNKEISEIEVICIKLLDYNINVITAYDYLCSLFNNNMEFIEKPRNILENYIKENPVEYVIKPPSILIKECLDKIKENKNIILSTEIKIKNNKQNIILNNDKFSINEESPSTSLSSSGLNLTAKLFNKKTSFIIDNQHNNNYDKNNDFEYLTYYSMKSIDPEEIDNSNNFSNYINFKTVIKNKNNKNTIATSKIDHNFKCLNSSTNNLLSKPYVKKIESKYCFTSIKKNKNINITQVNENKKGGNEFKKVKTKIINDTKKKLYFDRIKLNYH